MKERDKILEELKGLSGKLANMQGTGDGYSVPKDYFKKLPDEVLGRIRRESRVAEKINWKERLESLLYSFSQPRYVMVLATAIILVVAGIFLLNREPVTIESPIAIVQIENISDEALFSYVSDNIREFDREMLVNHSKTESNMKALQQITKPSAEEMDQYLDDILDDIELEDLQEIL